MHIKRLIVAALLLPVAYGYVMWLPEVFFTLLICAASALGLMEFFAMYRVRGTLRTAGLALGATIPLGVHVAGGVLTLLMLSFVVLAALRLFSGRGPGGSLGELGPVVLGIAYIPFLLSYLVGVRLVGPEWIVFLFGTIWGADSAALYVGKVIGKQKLYPGVSPNKTVAGAVASVIGGGLCALGLKFLMLPGFPDTSAFFAGVLIGAIIIVGDLVESMFKRDAGVKDSSALIPGHGGVLDKLDGALFAGPVLYLLLKGLEMLTKKV